MKIENNKPIELFPFYVDFAITYGCNARCQHCSINADFNAFGNSGDMDFKMICSIIDQLKNMGVVFIGLTGGEAITRVDILDIIDYCVNSNILVALATNAIALNEEVLQNLIQHRLNSIFISLDHYDRNIHNKIRGNSDAYDAAINGIELCVKNNFPVTVGITPMRDNYQDLGEIIDFIVDRDVKVVNVSNYVATGRGSQSLDLLPMEWKCVYEQVKNRMEKYTDKVRIQVHDVKMPLLMPELEPKSLGEYKGCLAGYSHCYILPNGDVHPCVMLPIKLGNLQEEKLSDILIKYQRDGNVIDKNKLSGRCGDCNLKNSCGGCRANAYAYYNDALGQDPHCWLCSGKSHD
ncbi:MULTISPECIES: radical SAM/SPASM domain-containing protein [Hungatella]|uniref:radical SAM/SPASM domain-containing protein n=1 Tax=Hungatella TaxID=1649459 RepID=UPI0011DD3969|nr:radical SAM protein [Hungatella hathewayi]